MKTLNKFVFSLLACCFLSIEMNAQDILVLKNGEVKNVFIVEIGKDFIFYCIEKNEGNTIYKIDKKEVFTIKKTEKYFDISIQKSNPIEEIEKDGKGSLSNNNSVSIKFSYISMTFENPIENIDATGFSFVANENFRLLKQLPLYLGIGAGLQYTGIDLPNPIDLKREYNTEFGNQTVHTKVSSIHFASFRFPITIGYKWKIVPELDFSIYPHLGLNMRWNFAGWIGYYSPFDKQEMKEVGLNAWDKFQTGYNIGCDVMLKRISIGLSYSKDFEEIDKKTKVSSFYVNFGYNF